jgi:hypothetical protein
MKEIPIFCSYKNNNSTVSLKSIFHGLGVASSVLRIRIKYRLSHLARAGENGTAKLDDLH